MNLHDLVGSKQEFLWSLVVEPGWVQAGIWTVAEGEAKVVAVSNPVPWEKEELVASCDTALSSVVQTLPETAKEPNKVVFGVSSSWVQAGQIKKEKLENLRALCSKLTLEPAGFVTLPEAVSFYIKSKEGTPLNAVVIALGREVLEVSVFSLGNFLGTTQIARSVSLLDDVVEGLARFKLKDPVPSRFILLDGKEGELEEAKQALLKGSWENLTQVKFLHTPKIEVLTSHQKIEAVSLGGATEIANVSKVNALDEKEDGLKQKEPAAPAQTETEVANLGFKVEQDVAQSEVSTDTNNVDTQPLAQGKVFSKPAIFEAFFSKFARLSQKVGRLLGGGKKPMFLGGGAVLLVAAFLVGFWWFYPKATVTIYISPQKLDEKVTMLVDTQKSEVDFENKVIPGKTVEKEESGEKTIETSGKKLVGEKAKGEVEIRNGTSDDLDLATGTLLTAGNNLEFVTDKSTTIPAQTVPGSPGTGTATVVASDIGPEYNLPKDESFKVGDYLKSQVDAVAKNDFTGGASREIQAVSEEDRERVLDELKNELTEKAQEALGTSTSEEEFFIDGSVTSSVLSQTYSGKAGDEADSLKLSLNLSVQGLVVSRQNLFDLAREVLKEKIPEGYILRETQIEYEFSLATDSDSESDTYELEGGVSVNLLPEVNTDEIAEAIVGKYPTVAEEYFTKIPGFVRAQISMNPRFPGKLGTLPRVRKNITVELAAER
ncbi:baseplate J/gp47 family protein [Candidatus Woesebacteria bacterium]|nr:baseplate J/gp47 family protein [Candidatus Woesebacteria bacterium]